MQILPFGAGKHGFESRAVIGLFKDTALCSVVSIQEVVFTAQILAARNFQYFTLYTIVGIMYFAVSFPAARLVGYLERVTKSGYRRKRS